MPVAAFGEDDAKMEKVRVVVHVNVHLYVGVHDKDSHLALIIAQLKACSAERTQNDV